MAEDEMIRYHQLNSHEFEPALEVGDGQGSLACCSPWGRKEWDMTEQLKNNNQWLLIGMVYIAVNSILQSISDTM